MIIKTDTLSNTLETYPELKDVFETNGFKGLDNKSILKQLGEMTLETVLKNRQIDVSIFVNMLNEQITDKVTDVTLMTNVSVEGAINIIGLLPCPVRLP